MLETLIVYGLILVFFVLLAVFVGVVLTSHPYTAPATEPTQHPAQATRVKISEGATNSLSYGIIVLLLLLFCVITVLDRKDEAGRPRARPTTRVGPTF